MAGDPLFSPRYIIYFDIEKEEVKQRVHLQSRDCTGNTGFAELSSIETLYNVESLWKN